MPSTTGDVAQQHRCAPGRLDGVLRRKFLDDVLLQQLACDVCHGHGRQMQPLGKLAARDAPRRADGLQQQCAVSLLNLDQIDAGLFHSGSFLHLQRRKFRRFRRNGATAHIYHFKNIIVYLRGIVNRRQGDFILRL